MKVAELNVKVFPAVGPLQLGNHVRNLHDLAEHIFIFRIDVRDFRLRQGSLGVGEKRRGFCDERLPPLANVEPRLQCCLFRLLPTVLLKRLLELPPILYLLGELNERSRSDEHTSELQSLMRNSYAVF